MCRNIQQLFNFDPPATEEDIRAAALQYVRKVSGMTKPSQTNEEAFNQAVEDITSATLSLFESLTTTAKPKNREEEIAKRRARNAKRFGN